MKKTTIYYGGLPLKVEFEMEGTNEIILHSINGIPEPEEYFQNHFIENIIEKIAEEEINSAMYAREFREEMRAEEARGN